MTWLLAHGIGGIRDLPVPRYVFYYGAAAVLVVSFVGLALLWKRPVLAERRNGRPLPPLLQRVLLSTPLRVVLGALSFALLVFLWLGALVGKNDSGVNFTPTFVYVYFWIAMPIRSSSSANVWSVLSPWKAAANGLGVDAETVRPRGATAVRVPGAARPLAGGGAAPPLRDDGAELSRPVRPARARAGDRRSTASLTWAGAVAFGSKAWFANGDGFPVDFQLLSRISAFGRRDDGHARRADAVLRPFDQRSDAGDDRDGRGHARLDVLRRVQPHEHLAEPLLRRPGRLPRPAEPRRPGRPADEPRRPAPLRRLRRRRVPPRRVRNRVDRGAAAAVEGVHRQPDPDRRSSTSSPTTSRC